MSKPAFDPSKSFVAEKPAFDPSAPFNGAEQSIDAPVSAGANAALNTLMMGHLPKVQAAEDYALQKIKGGSPQYGDLLSGYEKLAKGLEEGNPTSTKLGQLTGMAGQGLAMAPLVAAPTVGALRQIAGAAGLSGLMGQAQAAPDEETRATNAVTSGLLGGGISAVPTLGVKAAQKIAPMAAEMLAGVPADATRAYLANPAEIIGLDTVQGANALSNRVKQSVGKIKEQNRATWKALQKLLGGFENEGHTVSTQGAVDAFNSEIGSLNKAARGANNPKALVDQGTALERLRDKFLLPTAEQKIPIYEQRTVYEPTSTSGTSQAAEAFGSGEIDPRLFGGGGLGLPPGRAPQVQDSTSGPQINLPRDVTSETGVMRTGVPLYAPNVDNQLGVMETRPALRPRPSLSEKPPNASGTAEYIARPEVIPKDAIPGVGYSPEGPPDVNMRGRVVEDQVGEDILPGEYKVKPTAAARLLRTMQDVSKPAQAGLLQNAATEAPTALSQAERATMSKAAQSVSENLKGLHPDVANAYKDYSEGAQLAEKIGGAFDTPEDIYNTLSQLGRTQKDNLTSQLGRHIGSDEAEKFAQAATKIRALNFYGSPENNPVLAFGRDPRGGSPYLASQVGNELGGGILRTFGRAASQYGQQLARPAMRGINNAAALNQQMSPLWSIMAARAAQGAQE